MAKLLELIFMVGGSFQTLVFSRPSYFCTLFVFETELVSDVSPEFADLTVLREFNNDRKLYAFPSIERLASASELLWDGVVLVFLRNQNCISFGLAIDVPAKM